MEGYGATDLADNHSKLLKFSHYKMAHHGASTDRNQKDWFEAISPVKVHVSDKYIFVRYHHPRCDVFKRLNEVDSLGMANGKKLPAATSRVSLKMGPNRYTTVCTPLNYTMMSYA